MRQAGAIDAKFVDGPAIARAVSTGSGYEMEQFQQGMVAYAALTALQEPQFVQGVFDAGRDPRDRDEISAALLGDPKSVLELEGANAAAATVGGILAQMGAELVRSGQGIRKAAYDVQRQPWSKEAAPEPQKRLAEAKEISARRVAMTEEQTSLLMQNLVALRKTGPALGGRTGAPSPVVLRGLAVAALAVLGRAGDEDADGIAPLLSDAKSADCMKMAKLNLYQCLAVAGPHYEHAYCLGQHAVMDTGQCVISASGQSLIPAVTPISAPQPPASVKSRSVSVPMALVTPAGPERSRAYARGAAAAAADAPGPTAQPAPSREERLSVEEREEAPAPRQAARDERYAAPRDEEVYEREPEAPARRDERYDRYAEERRARDRYAPQRYAQDRYAQEQRYDDRYAPYGRGYRDLPQDYDPYAYEAPAYAYRYGR